MDIHVDDNTKTYLSMEHDEAVRSLVVTEGKYEANDSDVPCETKAEQIL